MAAAVKGGELAPLHNYIHNKHTKKTKQKNYPLRQLGWGKHSPRFATSATGAAPPRTP